MTTLVRGLTWDHPRAYEGLEPETRRFNARQGDVRLEWGRHSLRGFEATPIAELARDWDIITMDHPFVGDAAAAGCLVDLRPFGFEDVAADALGPSFASYDHAGGLWALPIDAACQAAVRRPDLMEAAPRTIEDVLALPRIALALAVPHAFMNYLAICGLLGADLSGEGEVLIPRAIGIEAIEVHRRLVALTPPEALGWSSIGALDAMVARDDLAYCPMVFCFNSYSRPSPEGRPRLAYGDLPDLGASGAGSVVGGAGLAVSALRPNRDAAIAALRHLMKAATQQRIAVDGGQPGRASVWRDAQADRANGGFFSACLGPMQRSKVRPRYAGYMDLQNGAGALLREDAASRPASAPVLYDAIEALHRNRT